MKPLLKKPNLISNDLRNYHLISNLSLLSKLAERVIGDCVSSHLSCHGLMSNLQSAYQKFHSTETALLYVHNDILASLDAGHSTVRSIAFFFLNIEVLGSAATIAVLLLLSI